MTALVFFWDNFGPMHVDRIAAVQTAFGTRARVVGIEFRSASETYAWDAVDTAFEKYTLFEKGQRPRLFRRLSALWSAFRSVGRGHYFLCHYERAEVLIAAWLLRLTGSTVTTMGCSKFDDVARSAGREFLKSWFLKPYHGAIASGIRSRDYLRFLGMKPDRIAVEYNTVSVGRFRSTAAVERAPDASSHGARHFTAVARFVPKKNLAMLVDAYGRYHETATDKRDLHLCGSGPLEADLRAQVARLGLSDVVHFRGFLQTEAIASVLSQSLALVLPSVEEQFGNVVIEAQALGLPVILSDNCGARDRLVRSGVNGFVIEPDNPEGLAYFMRVLSDDASIWARMAEAAYAGAEKGDVARFVEAVEERLATQ